jgi:hypothetical protein
MPLGPDPFQAFQIGSQIGKVNSPVSGLGDAIRGILDDARKKGLLQAQSQFQGEASNQVNILKEGRAEERLGLPKTTIFAGPGGERETVDTTRGTDVKSLPAPDPLAAFFAESLEEGGEEDQTMSAKARAFLQAQGALVTEANIKAVIEKGLIQ